MATSTQTRGGAKIHPPSTSKFLGYQKRWVNDHSRIKLIEKSRQIGLSWATAYQQVETTAPTEATHDVWVTSRDDIQARLFIEDCKAFANILQTLVNDLGETLIDPKKNSAYVLQFANGKRIHSMSSNPDAQAGKRGTRVLDEFALHPDQRKLWSIAYPGITWGGNMQIISTHRGSHSLFAQLIEEARHRGNPKNISLHRVTLEDALNQGFLAKLQSKLPAGDQRIEMDESEYFDYIKAGCVDTESFLQEYMCEPSDDHTAFLSYELIARCQYPSQTFWEIPLDECTGELYIGVDLGRDHDLTVITVLEKRGDTYYTRRMIELHQMPFDQQEAILYKNLSHPRVRRCCIDRTGLGRQFAERAQQKFGTYKVEPVHFTADIKEALAYPLRTHFEDRTLKIPNDAKLQSDLRGIKKETTAAGNIRFSADRGKNGHSDRFWALALALHAGKNPGYYRLSSLNPPINPRGRHTY